MHKHDERLARAFHATPIPMAVFDRAENRISEANRAFLELVESDRTTVLERGGRELGIWLGSEVWEGALRRVQEGHPVRELPATLRLSKDAGREVLLSVAPIEAAPDHGLVLVLQDVTGKKQAEQHLLRSQKMEAIGQLAAGVAHDFNNLLAIIHAHASLHLGSERLDQEVLESLRQVSLAAERASELTRKLLTFSRKRAARVQALDLRTVMSRMEPGLRRLIGEGVELAWVLPDRLPAVVGEASGIDQILTNLVVNARDALSEGGRILVTAEAVTLEAEALRGEPEARPGRFVCLSVADNGCGIPAELLSRIYEPFFTTKPVGNGTGLGLSTVYAMVKQHGGWVEVVSAPGQGTTFRVFLPAAKAGPRSRSHTTLFIKRQGAARCRETILILDDDLVLLSLSAQTLRQQGYQILQARNTAEALDVWDRSSRVIDLLIADLHLPEGSVGIELARRFQSERKTLRILFSTGYSSDLMQEDLMLLDGVNFLQKPYDIHRLVATVRCCLDAVEVPSGTTLPDAYEPFAEVPRPVLELGSAGLP